MKTVKRLAKDIKVGDKLWSQTRIGIGTAKVISVELSGAKYAFLVETNDGPKWMYLFGDTSVPVVLD